jgi:hypothetical protein
MTTGRTHADPGSWRLCRGPLYSRGAFFVARKAACCDACLAQSGVHILRLTGKRRDRWRQGGTANACTPIRHTMTRRAAVKEIHPVRNGTTLREPPSTKART